MAKQKLSEEDFRIIFKTKDGQLVMNRFGDRQYWTQDDQEFIKMSLDSNSRERGVRVMSYKINRNDCTAIVEWV